MHKVGELPYMVFISVRQDDAAHAHLFERRKVGMDDVDPEAAVVERDSAVDEDGLAVLLQRERVHPDLAEPPERNDANCHAKSLPRTDDKTGALPYVEGGEEE